MKYEVWFKLVNEEKELEVNFKLPVYNQPIVDAVKNFNDAGEIARNRKHIYKTEIEEHIIKIFFESDIDLESPTKNTIDKIKQLIKECSIMNN